MVSDTGGQAWFCGGSLIARDVVLTAGHCLVSDNSWTNVTDIDVWVNSSATEYTEYQHYRQGLQWVVHPDFDIQSTYANDIGLIFLDELVEGVTLVKMNRDASIPVSIDPPALTAIGLGYTFWNESTGDKTRPKLLMQVPIYPSPTLYCAKLYGSWNSGTSSICAGGNGVTGICYGDSGSPLLLKKTSAGSDVQVGITSFGGSADCVKVDYPDSYTRVSSFATWIDEQICEYSMDEKFKTTHCKN